MYQVFLVEDDKVIARTIKRHLEKWDYEVVCVNDFANVMAEFAQCSPHLVLMDIKLPFYNGYHWCTQIRRLSKVPIIFLSSAADNMNIVMAVNMGGDDFVPKPFDLEVLTAKVQALLRRSYDFTGASALLEHEGVMLHLNDASIYYKDTKLELSKNEWKIMQILLENKGEVVAREEMMCCLWESDEYVDENTLSVNVNRLRKRLASIGVEDFIQTRKGIGYQVG